MPFSAKKREKTSFMARLRGQEERAENGEMEKTWRVVGSEEMKRSRTALACEWRRAMEYSMVVGAAFAMRE